MQQLLKDSRREIKNLQLTLNSRNEELRQLTENRTKLLEEQLRIHKEMQEIKQAKENLENLRSKETSLEETVMNFDEKLIQIGNQCETANRALEQAKVNYPFFETSNSNFSPSETLEIFLIH